MRNSVLLAALLFAGCGETTKTLDPDSPICLKLNDGGYLIVESKRTVIFMTDKDGAITWVSRYFDLWNKKVVEMFDAEGAKKRGITLPAGAPADHIFVNVRPDAGKDGDPVELYHLSLKERQWKSMGAK